MNTSFLAEHLRLPPLASREQDAVAELPPDEMFVDADFIPASVAVSVDPLKVEALQVAQWRPLGDALPEAALFLESPAQCDLVCNQEFDDTWLAGAMALVATRPELLNHLFGSIEFLERGILTMRLFKHGAWHPVTIDTMLPCRADGNPSFISAAHGEVLWPSLLTKAMAKLHGSYAALAGGEATDALVDLTAGHVSHEPLAVPMESEAEAKAYVEGVWKGLCRGMKRGHLQAGVTPAGRSRPAGGLETAEDVDAELNEHGGGYASGLLPKRLYPILFVKEPQPGLRLVCLRDPWLEPPPPTATIRPWAEKSIEWSRYRHIAEELLPLSDEVGKCIWIELGDFVRSFEEVLSVQVAGATTEAVICEGTWHEHSAGGPRTLPSWCINPQYWVTVAKDTTLTIDLSQPDVRLPAIRHASSSTAQAAAAAQAANGGLAPEPYGEDADTSASYFPISVCVIRGGPPSTMDYGRVWHGDNEKSVVGETLPAKRRGVGLSVQLAADRAYCVVACCPAGYMSPFVLRLQSETPFTLKQAQPATVARLPHLWDPTSSGGPRTSKSWTINPQYWLTIRPPPTSSALARVRLTVEAAPPTAEQHAASKKAVPALASPGGRPAHASNGPMPPDVGFTLFRGEFNRDRFGRSRASQSSARGASPPASRPGTAPNGRGRSASRSPRNSPGRERPGTHQGSRDGSKGMAGPGLMEVQGHEQLVEFNSIDRNGDGIISQAEMEVYRKMNKGPSQGVASSLAANLPSISEATNGHGPLSGSAMGSPYDDELLPPAGPAPLLDGSTLDLAPVGSYNLAFGLPVRDTAESQPVRRHQADKSELIASVVAESPTASTVLKLDPGVPYVLSVHTARAGELSDYTLSAFSDAVLSLSLIETTTQRVLRGNWRSSNAGGSHIESPGKWTINPMYSLRVASETTVDITLERPSNKWKSAMKINTLESMMGFYVLQGEAPGQRLRPEYARECIVHQTVFLPAHEVKASLYLDPLPNGAPYIIMPATFGAGQRGPFSLGVNTDIPCELEALPESSATVSAQRDATAG